ncbi:MAG: tRNA (guanosine(37)-N1)-methyltransferase TrmD [Clostridia bacterium]|nr:tRNA (guanosine(37)-N1)-methyltransferase TrmD [Clostridia bacterium]MBQ3573346.1 tRNA (guanosine(37)-N1)-methyltransferase TrmD [Clostridia bacterium]
MRIDILTLFPETVDAFLQESMIGRGRRDGLLDIRCHNIRDYCTDRYRRTDDYPYGGGQGMIMLCEPLARCLEEVKEGEQVHTLLMSPRGKTFTQQKAVELLKRDRFAIVCGHYEGIDQRFIDECIDEEISLGDFVLTGGEIAAITIADAVGRMVPGVLAESASFEDESHFSGLLEYPQYTRPEVWRDIRVPDVLLSGHHENIRKWRRKQSLEITREKRPDMFEKLELTKEDKKLLEV